MLFLDLSARSYTGIKGLVSPCKENSFNFLNTETQANSFNIINNSSKTSTPTKYENNSSNVICKNEFSSKNQEDFNVCPICLDYIDFRKHETIGQSYYNYNTNITGIVQVLCGHMFHIECCLKLDDDKCPLCRFNLSPSYVSTCTLCTCENDLWMCLVCGSINCGEEGGSSNHRKEHYINSGHIYARGIGETHNVTFDFSHNIPLHILLRNTMINHQEQNAEYSKDPKEKVEYILSEYNSITSSQLENQRIYYLNLLRKIEDSYHDDDKKLDEEISKKSRELKSCLDDIWLYNDNKIKNMTLLKNNDSIIKNNDKILADLELEYIELLKEKQKYEDNTINDEKKIKKNIEEVTSEIDELQNQIKEMNIHIKTLNKSKKLEIAESSIHLIINNGAKKNSKNK